MASSSDGRREIEAAKLRLAAAKSQTTVATKMLASAEAAEESAKKTSAMAREQMISCLKETEKADQYLQEAEKRWKVIGNTKEEGPDSPENKRRKVNARVTPTSITTTVQPGVTSTANNCNGNKGQANEMSNAPDYIIVQGSGSSDIVNGRYNKSWHQRGRDPAYFKPEQWNGKRLGIFYNRHHSSWRISTQGGYSNIDSPPLFFYSARGEAHIPPKDGWSVQRNGIAPAPRLDW